MTANEQERGVYTSPIIINKQSMAAKLLNTTERKRLGLPGEISLKRRTRRRRGKQGLRKKGKK